jgi:hypothetical protein
MPIVDAASHYRGTSWGLVHNNAMPTRRTLKILVHAQSKKIIA